MLHYLRFTYCMQLTNKLSTTIMFCWDTKLFSFTILFTWKNYYYCYTNSTPLTDSDYLPRDDCSGQYLETIKRRTDENL